MYGVFRKEGHSERAVFIIDKEGLIRYIDVHDISKQPSNDEIRNVLLDIDPDLKLREEKVDEGDLPEGGVVLYCTPWCPDCRKARDWLAARDIDFTEVDISKNPKAAKKVMSWAGGYRTTPTFDINGTIIVDWNETDLVEAFKTLGEN